MNSPALAAERDIGPAVLNGDGSVTLAGGLTLRKQTLTNHRFAGGVLEVVSKGSSTRVAVRFDDGRTQTFAFSKDGWRELSGQESAGGIGRILDLVKQVRWTGRKVAAVAAVLLVVLLVVLLTSGGSEKVATVDQGTRAADQAGTRAPATGTPTAGPKMSDEEILRSQHLTFQQKRSQLYDLAESVGDQVAEARHQANYARTNMRLSRFEVKLSPEAERGLAEVADRVERYAKRISDYCGEMQTRSARLRMLAEGLFQQVKAGTLNEEVRALYVAVTEPADFSNGPFQHEVSAVAAASDAKDHIMRSSMSASDLFHLLVAIRCCQRRLETAGPRDDKMARLFEQLPADLLKKGDFDRGEIAASVAALEEKHKQTTEALKHAVGGSQEQFELSSEAMQLSVKIDERRFLTKDTLVAKIVIPPQEREELARAMADDAGVLEDALQEQLLDYPWPWKVTTVKPKKRLFEIAAAASPS